MHNVYVSGVWEDAGVPRERNPHRHRENTQTPQWKSPDEIRTCDARRKATLITAARMKFIYLVCKVGSLYKLSVGREKKCQCASYFYLCNTAGGNLVELKLNWELLPFFTSKCCCSKPSPKSNLFEMALAINQCLEWTTEICDLTLLNIIVAFSYLSRFAEG